MTIATDPVRQQAEYLAAENRASDPDIQRIFWFPHPSEVRLLEVVPSTVPALDDQVHPFYFREAPADNLPYPSGVALIRPDEFEKLELPANWGSWNTAVEI